MGVNLAFVKDNQVYSYSRNLKVEEESNPLTVEVLTYRDKIEPGSAEKWTVKITGKNKDAAAAEVLTSMYDASLDQFKPHAWQIPFDPQPNFYTNGWDNNNGFTTAVSSENNLPLPNKYYWKQYADIDVFLSNPYNEYLRKNGMVSGEKDYDKVYTKVERQLSGRVAGVQANSNLNDVVVIGYGATRKQSITGAVSNVMIRGLSSLPGNPLYVVDGKIVSSMDDVNQDDILKIEVLKDAQATALYGARGANGVVVITTKNGAAKAEEPVVKVRTNFNETAFFFPQLVTDKDGNVSFTFTLPDALTQWKWQMLAHDKNASFGINQKTIVSQKTLMVQANAPRFMREGDKMEFSAKVSNVSDKELKGKATLKLVDAVTLEPVDGIFINTANVQNFTAAPGQSAAVNFSIAIPANFNKPVPGK